MSKQTIRMPTAVAGVAFLLAGCATAPVTPVAVAPVMEVPPAMGPVAVQAPEPTPEDSAADADALLALQTLEFGSLAKGGDHVRGVVPSSVSDRISRGSAGLSNSATGGGAASASGPTFDIDVESYASHRRVEYYKDFFLGPSRDRFRIWLGRLNRYEGMIRNRFRQQGIPEDLVYLGLIESGYSNTAVSRASAVGMWQFISSTGRQYSLRVDEWVDDRRDPFRATDAAARHLWDLKERFGSWYLAAAAYNGGSGRVSRGLNRLGSRDTLQSDDAFFALYDGRYLRRETKDYVPKLIAAAMIAKDPLPHGFESIPYLGPLVFDEITVPDATGLDVLAHLADTTLRAMVELNPRYYRGVTPPGRSAIVRVPRETGSKVARRYAELPPSERVNFKEHTIRKGETLGILAQRYGVSLDLILAANRGIEPRRLRVDQRVVIPVSLMARSNPSAAPRPVQMARRYTVRRGDSLWSIAKKYRVRISDLRRWNGIRGSHLRVGQRLTVGTGSP